MATKPESKSDKAKTEPKAEAKSDKPKADPKSEKAKAETKNGAKADTKDEAKADAKPEKGKGKKAKAAKPKPKVKQMGIWGIDLGQCALKAVRLEVIEGEVTATAFDYIEHPKILSQPDADPDQLTREALEGFLKRNDLKGDMVVISVPGQSGLARFVKLPPVEEKKIDAIVTFEAKQQIPFPLEEVIWDYQKLNQGSVSDGYALETEIGLFAMKKDVIHRALQQFKDVNVEVHVVQMTPLALCNFVAFDQLGKGSPRPKEESEGEQEQEEPKSNEKECVVALDIGADNSNLVITDGERIIWQRPIPLGGNHFTRALTKEMKLTFAKAEHIKRNAIKSPDLRKILTALRPVLNDFVGEVQRSLGFFTNTHRNAIVTHMIGLGNVFRLPGLQKFLQEKLQLDVVKVQNFQRLRGDAVVNAPQFTENIMSFAVAYGLALQGLNLTRLQTNLLPKEIRVERMVRAKKPWAVAAAAALLLAVAGLTFGRSIQYNTVTHPDVGSALKKGEEATQVVNSKKSAYDGFLREAEESGKAVNRIGSNVDERHNWILVYKYINDCLPLPFGMKLPKETDTLQEPFRKYWTKDADQAYKKWNTKRNTVHKQDEEKTQEDPVEKKKEQQEVLKNLVQINIEGINCLYSDDLSIYFNNLKKKTQGFVDGWIHPKDKSVIMGGGGGGEEGGEEGASGLPKKGWVFEVRGYTHHKDKHQFVINSLIANLRYPEKMYLGSAGNQDYFYKLPKEVKERVKDHISFVCLYKEKRVDRPMPNQFKLIGKSHLRELVFKQQGGGGAFAMPAAGGMDEDGAPGEPVANGGGGAKGRETWASLGEIAAKVLGAGAGTGFGEGPGGFDPEMPMPDDMPPPGEEGLIPPNGMAQVPLQPRVEFIIFFVWEEPTTLAEEGGGDAPEG